MTAPTPRTIRQDEHDRLLGIIDEMRAESAVLRDELKKNSEATAKISEMVHEMVELFSAAKGFFKMLGWIGSGVKWIALVVAACAALWALLMHGGVPPTK